MELLNVTKDSSCNSTPMNLLSLRDRLHLEQEKGLLLNCSICTKENRSEANQQTEVRQARIDDTNTVRSHLLHSVDPSAWS